jgi:hypothetical protein
VRFHLIVVLIAFAGALPAFAQESPEATKPLVHQHNAGDATSDLFPSREGSGTTWLPDDTPMNGVEFSWRGWRLMAHGVAFAQFLYEPSISPADSTRGSVSDRLAWMHELLAAEDREAMPESHLIGVLACLVGGVILAHRPEQRRTRHSRRVPQVPAPGHPRNPRRKPATRRTTPAARA